MFGIGMLTLTSSEETDPARPWAYGSFISCRIISMSSSYYLVVRCLVKSSVSSSSCKYGSNPSFSLLTYLSSAYLGSRLTLATLMFRDWDIRMLRDCRFGFRVGTTKSVSFVSFSALSCFRAWSWLDFLPSRVRNTGSLLLLYFLSIWCYDRSPKVAVFAQF